VVTLTDTYKEQAQRLKLQPFDGELKTSWRSPSNIALVKYWGKRKNQLPQNPSLSFGLKKSYSETAITYSFNNSGSMNLEFLFEGKLNETFAKRIYQFLTSVSGFLPYLPYLNLKIESTNSFPHSSGIASSASAMSALALCLVSIEQNLLGTLKEEKEFFEKASFLARLGSGSAARSIYPGFVVWGKDHALNDSSDEIAIPITGKVHHEFEYLYDSILITSSAKKQVSSSAGHGLMDNHPYAHARYRQAGGNLRKIMVALEMGNENEFTEVLENEALSLHALMISSNPGFSLLNNNSWEIINRVINYRTLNNRMIAFTLDAGPNVHLIYKSKDKTEINNFINSELVQYCENGYWINDEMGKGPEKLL
jgi:diphosphomevalonate decarboxylase